MLSEPLAVTVDTEAYSLARVNQDNFRGTYFDESADGLSKATITTAHTVPASVGGTESHMVRMDIARYDASNNYTRTDSVWMVFKTTGGPQNTAALEDIYQGLTAFLEATSNTALLALLGRQS